VHELERERDAAEGFAALAAHELVSPLVMAEACAALATDRLLGAGTPDVVDALELMARSAARTRLIVESLLHESRATTQPLRRDPVDLATLVRECAQVLTLESESRDAKIVVSELPTVRGSADLLGGVFTNLLANALKYNPRRGGTIRVGAQAVDGAWMIFVDDEAPTIPPEDRERIFEPYCRGRGERRAKGAGLGLAICRRIVERHGGRIAVATAPGGNRFFFTLPV
jgi:signal transduction histidine kinase